MNKSLKCLKSFMINLIMARTQSSIHILFPSSQPVNFIYKFNSYKNDIKFLVTPRQQLFHHAKPMVLVAIKSGIRLVFVQIVSKKILYSLFGFIGHRCRFLDSEHSSPAPSAGARRALTARRV